MPSSLTDRDRAALEHLRRYRITTAKVLQKLYCDDTPNKVKKLVQRLGENIQAEQLYGKSVYYHLSPTGARLVGAPEEVSKPLGPQALPKAIGILYFCCMGEEPLFRYTRSEFADDFPELAESVMKREFYLDYYPDFDGQTARLGQFMVDLGGDYQKFVSKCRVRVREGLRTEGLQELILENLFTIAILVAEPEKKNAILEAFQGAPMKAAVRVEVIPELSQVQAKGMDE